MVKVNALHRVVSMTTVLDSVPSCPIFLAMMKQLTVVALPNIIRMATSFSDVNPIHMAMGRNIATKTINLIKVQRIAGFHNPLAFCNWKDAPMAIRPRGVASTERLFNVFCMITGCLIPDIDQRKPAIIPKMIGLLAIPLIVLMRTSFPILVRSLFNTESTMTAMTLYKGTLAKIINGAIVECP